MSVDQKPFMLIFFGLFGKRPIARRGLWSFESKRSSALVLFLSHLHPLGIFCWTLLTGFQTIEEQYERDMQPIWQSLLLTFCVLAIVGVSVDAAVTFRCPSGACQGPLQLIFNTSAGCDGEAIALPAYNITRYPNLGENVCLNDSIVSSSYTCGNGEYRSKMWIGDSCSGDPLVESMRKTHTCYRQFPISTSNLFVMIICGPDDLNAPIIPHTNNLPKPSDPTFTYDFGEPCPNDVCRAGYATYTSFNESGTCTGHSSTSEASGGILGICYKDQYSPFSFLTLCDETVLRRYEYSGSCDDQLLGYSDQFRRPATCTRFDPHSSRNEISCPIISPQFPPPMAPMAPVTPSGHASSMSLPLLLYLILGAVVSCISF